MIGRKKMADLTLDEFRNIPEESLHNLLREEEKTLFDAHPPKTSMSLPVINRTSTPNISLGPSLLETNH